MIEWKENLINPEAVEFLKYDTHYSDVYDVAYGGGTKCAYIFLKERKMPLLVACNKVEFESLKALLEKK